MPFFVCPHRKGRGSCGVKTSKQLALSLRRLVSYLMLISEYTWI